MVERAQGPQDLQLRFIAGIYGMNSEYMPELRFRYGYFVVLGGMALLAGGLIGAEKPEKRSKNVAAWAE